MTMVELCVHMDCSGCESKIKKALHRLKGVDEVEVDMAMQKVTVTGWADQKKVLKAVRKTGRRAVLWPYPYGAEHRGNYTEQYYHRHHPTESGHHTHHHHHHPASYGPTPSSSYNYYKHGYDDFHGYGYYQRPGYSSSIVDERAGALFSDDNPNACSIM